MRRLKAEKEGAKMTSTSCLEKVSVEAEESSKRSACIVLEENTKVGFSAVLEDDSEADTVQQQHLCAVGVRKRSFLGLVGIKIYAFGIYADCEKLKELINQPLSEDEKPKEASKVAYEVAIGSDASMTIKLVIVFGSLTMHMVRKIFNDNLGASIKKFSSSDHGELLESVLGNSKEDIKLPVGSVILISKLPGFVLRTKVKGEIVSEVKSQLLCKAFFNMYLGENPIDVQAKAKFAKHFP